MHLRGPVGSSHCKKHKFIASQCHAQIIISKVSVTGWAQFQRAPAGHSAEGQARGSDVRAWAERSEQGAHRSTSRSLNPRVVSSSKAASPPQRSISNREIWPEGRDGGVCCYLAKKRQKWKLKQMYDLIATLLTFLCRAVLHHRFHGSVDSEEDKWRVDFIWNDWLLNDSNVKPFLTFIQWVIKELIEAKMPEQFDSRFSYVMVWCLYNCIMKHFWENEMLLLMRFLPFPFHYSNQWSKDRGSYVVHSVKPFVENLSFVILSFRNKFDLTKWPTT